MSYPQQPSNWNDPSWPSQQPAGYPAQAHPVSGDPASPVGHPQPGYPASGYAPSGYPADAGLAQPGQLPPGYPGYGYPGYPGYGYPPAPPTNGKAIAAMVVGIVGILGLCGYLIGGYVGIVAAILGHRARRQIRASQEQGKPEQGEGMALAGIITGWIAFGIALLATIAFGIAIAIGITQGTNS